MGVVVGAGSSLWIERRIRQTVHEAASRLQPDALAQEIGRSARQMAGSTSERVRSAVSVGRAEMQLHEEQLWQELAERRGIPISPATPGAEDPSADEWFADSAADSAHMPTPTAAPVAGPTSQPKSQPTPQPNPEPRPPARARRRNRAESAKSPSHLGK
jgi:hypothetical protein